MQIWKTKITPCFPKTPPITTDDGAVDPHQWRPGLLELQTILSTGRLGRVVRCWQSSVGDFLGVGLVCLGLKVCLKVSLKICLILFASMPSRFFEPRSATRQKHHTGLPATQETSSYNHLLLTLWELWNRVVHAVLICHVHDDHGMHERPQLLQVEGGDLVWHVLDHHFVIREKASKFGGADLPKQEIVG